MANWIKLKLYYTIFVRNTLTIICFNSYTFTGEMKTIKITSEVLWNTSHNWFVCYKEEEKRMYRVYDVGISRAVIDRPTRECLPSSRLSYCTRESVHLQSQIFMYSPDAVLII